MSGTLFGVAGRSPAQLSTAGAAPSCGNSCRMRRVIAAQRVGLTAVS